MQTSDLPGVFDHCSPVILQQDPRYSDCTQTVINSWTILRVMKNKEILESFSCYGIFSHQTSALFVCGSISDRCFAANW